MSEEDTATASPTNVAGYKISLLILGELLKIKQLFPVWWSSTPFNLSQKYQFSYLTISVRETIYWGSSHALAVQLTEDPSQHLLPNWRRRRVSHLFILIFFSITSAPLGFHSVIKIPSILSKSLVRTLGYFLWVLGDSAGIRRGMSCSEMSSFPGISSCQSHRCASFH